MSKKRRKLIGRVEKIIKSPYPQEAEKAQIEIEGADDLYKDIRIENVVSDDKGEKVPLKQGQHVDVIVEADSEPEPENHAAKPKGS